MSLSDEITYCRQKRRIKYLSERNTYLEKVATIFIWIATIILLVTIAIIIWAAIAISKQKIDIANLSTENARLIKENQSISDSYNTLAELMADTSILAVELDDENSILKGRIDDLETALDTYYTRSELYDKYNWAMVRSDGSRTDIQYSQLLSLEELIEDKGMEPETLDLVLAIAMVESNGVEDAKNPESTASGFGGFLSGTGKFVYTELMNNDSYNHSDVAMNGTDNLQMIVYYLDYLNDLYDGNLNEVIRNYRGLDSPSYKAQLNSLLEANDLSLENMCLRASIN